ncbi:unnamed protein product [Linum trigynum]|uniref:Uncharacterized protein n=1 Tax=Linum trigynum TaxID=586398 RepID=A0AAV2G9W9_9ROSI
MCYTPATDCPPLFDLSLSLLSFHDVDGDGLDDDIVPLDSQVPHSPGPSTQSSSSSSTSDSYQRHPPHLPHRRCLQLLSSVDPLDQLLTSRHLATNIFFHFRLLLPNFLHVMPRVLVILYGKML